MYKNIIRAAFLFATGICMTACSSGDDNIADNTIPVAPGTKENVVTLTGTISAGGETTRALGTDGISISWTDGDVIAVHYQKTDNFWATVQGTISNITNNGHDAKFTAKLIDPKNSSNIGLAYPYSHVSSLTFTANTADGLDFDYTCLSAQSGTTASITSNKQDLAKTTAMDIALNISGATATLSKNAELANQVCIAKFTLYEGTSGSTTPFNTTSLTVTDNTHSKSYAVTTETKTNEFFVVLPAIEGSITIKAIGQQRYSGIPQVITSSRTDYTYGDYIVVDPSTRQAYTATVSSTPTDNEYSQTYGNSKLKAGKFYAQPIYYPIQDYTPVAVIAHVGAIKSAVAGYTDTNAYCEHFLALALEDAYTSVMPLKDDTEHGLSGAYTAVAPWASGHAIKISGDDNTYNSVPQAVYDQVQDNRISSSAQMTTTYASNTRQELFIKGWRVPSVTDFRYIFQDLMISRTTGDYVIDQTIINATTPVGIADQDAHYYSGQSSFKYGTSGDRLLYTYINNLCGNTNLQGQYYWLNSQVISREGTLQNQKAWRFSFSADQFEWNENLDQSLTRLVFAY